MSVNSNYRSLISSLEHYEDVLKTVSEETFQQNPSDGGWSYSETFSHIFQSNLGCLIAIEKCYLGTGILNRQRGSIAVWLILLLGMLPPGKFKAPERIASMVKKISREEACNLIVKFRNRLTDMRNKAEKAGRYQKIKHPRLGLLNARQWFRFMEIHTIHHTKQLQRIKSKLSKSILLS